MSQNIRTPSITESINADGFRGWHEYELTRSFGYLGLGLIALIASLSILESFFSAPTLTEKLFKAFLSFCALCFAAWSWQRFIDILLFAESLSKQAVCAGCGRYAALTVVQEQPRAQEGLRVLTCRCKKCTTEWQMSYALESRHDRT